MCNFEINPNGIFMTQQTSVQDAKQVDRNTSSKLGRPVGKQGRARQIGMQARIQTSKQTECCCMKLAGPKARQTHRSGRVMLMLFKMCTLPLFHSTVASKHHMLAGK